MTFRRGDKRPFLSQPIFLALAAALMLALARPARAQYPPWCTGSSTDGTTNLKSSSESMYIYSSTNYGTCGNCYLSIYASEGMTRSKPGKPEETARGSLYFSCYDYCTGGANGFSASYSTSDGSGISVSKNSASMTATLQFEYGYNYGSSGEPFPQTAQVSVQGSANGLSNYDSKCRYSNTVTTPCATVVSSHNNNGYQDQSATFTGSFTLGGTTYNIPAPASGTTGNGGISKGSSVTRTVVKNA